MELHNFIFMAVQTVIFLIPLLAIFYKQGRRDQVLDETVRDVNGLGLKVSEIRNDNTKTLSELKIQLEVMSKSLIETSVTMGFIQKDLEELKKR